jgi:hypothetical protein
MSTVRTNNVQVGQSVTATNNFTLYQPTTPDGTVRLGVGNTGATTADVITATSAGNVGIGTSSPSFANFSSSSNGVEIKSSSTYGILRLGGATGEFYAASGDTGIAWLWNRSNAATVFATNNTERARITSTGNFLVGTTDFTANGIGFKVVEGRPTTANAATTNATTTYEAYSTGVSAFRFYVGYGGTVFATSTTISAISDQRLKENVRDLDAGLAEVMALKPRLYDWKEGKGADIKNARGFIAQEFETVFPDLIDEWKDPVPEGEEPYKSVRADLIPVLVKAIQELKAELDSVKAELAALKAV